MKLVLHAILKTITIDAFGILIELLYLDAEQSIFPLLEHHQTEPPTAVALAEVTPHVEMPSGEDVADPLPRKPIQG